MIIVFSGTGNSLAVAEELQKLLGGGLVKMEGDLLSDPAGRVLEVAGDENVVWVFPVYSWGVPPVVGRFIWRCKLKGGHMSRHFMVCTCGDDTGYADSQWRKLIGKRGWRPCGAFSVQMPNTYVLMDGFDVDAPEVADAKVDAMPQRVADVAVAIERGFMGDDMVRGKMAWLKTAVVYPLFKRFCMSPRLFHATDSCSSCGKCAGSCPLGNIAMSGGSPKWGDRCALCLRCYHICPVHAVAYGDKTAGKGQKRIAM